MIITVRRVALKDNYTIGKLYIDGEYFCDTIEDKDRGLSTSTPLEQIRAKKIYAKTAIPTGDYDVILSYSSKFGKILPEILDVPGWTGVRIHSGNTADDSLGCIIVGTNDRKGWVSASRDTMNKLMEKLQKADIIKLKIQ